MQVGPHRLGGDPKITDGHACGLAGLENPFDGTDDSRVVELPHFAEAGGKVIRPKHDAIDPLHAYNRLDVFNRFDVFRLDNDGHLFIGCFQVFRKAHPVAVRPAEAHAASALRRVACKAHHVLSLLHGVDLRGDDSCRTQVEYFFDRHLRRGGQSHNARNPVANGLEDALNVAVLEGAVFGIEEQPVETDVGQYFRGGRRGEGDHGAKQRFAVL